MRVEPVSAANRPDFEAYCRLHRYDHDESFLSDHDLAAFDPEGDQDRGLLLRDRRGVLRGVAALMLRPDLRAAGKARFRVLHVDESLSGAEASEGYRALVSTLAPAAAGLDWFYLFLPEKAGRARAILEGLGFGVERYAWLLERDLAAIPEPGLPAGFTFRDAELLGPGGEPGPDADTWCSLVNAAFASLAGHTELLPSRLVAEREPALDFPGSWRFVEEGSRPVGLCATVRDIDELATGAFLGPVAVLPSHQGRGLGRALLRAGLASARAAGCRVLSLSVNAENALALRLYLDEGFTKKLMMVCLRRRP